MLLMHSFFGFFYFTYTHSGSATKIDVPFCLLVPVSIGSRFNRTKNLILSLKNVRDHF